MSVSDNLASQLRERDERIAAAAKRRDREWYEELGYEWSENLPTRREVCAIARENRQNAIKAIVLDRLPLCPDHRDKLTDCPSCGREVAERKLAEAEEAIRRRVQIQRVLPDGEWFSRLADWNNLPAVRRALGKEEG